MAIVLDAALGAGPTEMAAFDHALRQTGTGNYNLVRLSSVIPPGAELMIDVAEPSPCLSGGWGDRLYCVYAAETTRRAGEEVWAGIGWVHVEGGDGRGLFVEHEGLSEEFVRGLIDQSLADMCAGRPERFTAPQSYVIGTECPDDQAVCALVIAKYETESWTNRIADDDREMVTHGR
jgi:arginine decarboxylase